MRKPTQRELIVRLIAILVFGMSLGFDLMSWKSGETVGNEMIILINLPFVIYFCYKFLKGA